MTSINEEVTNADFLLDLNTYFTTIRNICILSMNGVMCMQGLHLDMHLSPLTNSSTEAISLPILQRPALSVHPVSGKGPKILVNCKLTEH